MKITELPEEMTTLFAGIPNWETAISDEVVDILIKLRQGWNLTENDRALLISTAEVAAIWSLTSNREVKQSYIKEVRKLGRITPAKSLGAGKGRRDLYTVEEIIGYRVSTQRGRRPGAEPAKHVNIRKEQRHRRQQQEEAA